MFLVFTQNFQVHRITKRTSIQSDRFANCWSNSSWFESYWDISGRTLSGKFVTKFLIATFSFHRRIFYVDSNVLLTLFKGKFFMSLNVKNLVNTTLSILIPFKNNEFLWTIVSILNLSMWFKNLTMKFTIYLYLFKQFSAITFLGNWLCFLTLMFLIKTTLKCINKWIK